MIDAKYRVRHQLVLIALLVVTGWVYAQVANFDYVFEWDDNKYIFDDPMVRQGLSWQGVVYAFTATYPFLMPLVRLAFMAQVSWFGLDPGGFHLVNVAFHLANVYLLYLCISFLTGSPWKGVAVAAVLALHPQHVEAVAWITELKEVMSGFFGLLSLWCYGRYTRLVGVAAKKALSWSLLAFMGSLLCKPMWVTLPFLLLLVDFWPLGRWQTMGWQVVVEKKVYFFLAMIFSLVTVATFTTDGVITPLKHLSWDYRLTKMVTAYPEYLWKAVVPLNLSGYYPYPMDPLPIPRILAMMALFLGITSLAWLRRHSHPYLLMGWLWFFGMLFPVLGLIEGGVPIGLADRWSYMAHVGLALAAIWQVEAWTLRKVWHRVAAVGLFCLVLGWWGVLTVGQVETWQNAKTLWARAALIYPDDGLPNWKLGRYYFQTGQFSEAVREFRAATLSNPKEVDYQLLWWLSLRREGRMEEARVQGANLRKRLAGDDRALVQGGKLFLQEGAFRESSMFFQDVLANQKEEEKHANWVRFPLAMALYAGGQGEKGEAHLKDLLVGEGEEVAHRCKVATGFLRRGQAPKEAFLPMIGAIKKYCDPGKEDNTKG